MFTLVHIATEQELRKTERCNMVERLFDLREGLKKDDPLKGEMLVDRYFYEPWRLGALDAVGAKFDREKTQRNEGRVLQYERCDEDGIPPRRP